MNTYSNTKKDNYHSLSEKHLPSYLGDFVKDLSKKGYTDFTIKIYFNSITHFCTWLHRKGMSVKKINRNVVSNFAEHHCHCPGIRKTKKISRKYLARVLRFVFYLSQQHIISYKQNSSPKLLSPYLKKFRESLQDRGLALQTTKNYMRAMNTLLPLLGNNPRKYDAIRIQKVICHLAKKKSRPELKRITTALRVYLRFLATEKVCQPDLDITVPTLAEWKLSSLPKYISSNEVESVIASCDIHTQQGMRDRAIILLLSRLGLRAGDVSNLRIDDIDWSKGTLRVSGKGRREYLLPLPQEVGDAILVYINKVRPPIAIEKLFLSLNAPYRAFKSSTAVSCLVKTALIRADVKNPPSRGAGLLRHSAATSMLRKGATLDTVSALLRHRSLDMTGYYAKVDVPRLMQIAQPWPEGAPC